MLRCSISLKPCPRKFLVFFATYVQKWNMPKHLNATSLHLLFADKKVKGYREKNKFTCQASEVLTLLPVMVHFCKSVVQPANCAPDACKAFLAVATVVFLLSEGQQAGITTPGLLQEAVEACLAACFAAGWGLIPKYHWPLHMPSQLQRWGKLLSCFTCERKTKLSKSGETPCTTPATLKVLSGKKSWQKKLLGCKCQVFSKKGLAFSIHTQPPSSSLTLYVNGLASMPMFPQAWCANCRIAIDAARVILCCYRATWFKQLKFLPLLQCLGMSSACCNTWMWKIAIWKQLQPIAPCHQQRIW